ncbi:chaoptin-like [Anopheles moucheti]|uniref:chaoptin-like n=1 Tax=Anopheles moucheti TaxID=186751 RepID=UPI0022F050E9|nr:chaoptin-like [Anopheles moucheti]
MKKLPKTLLDSFRKVEKLDLTDLQIEEIEPNVFTNGIYIRELYLGLNDIRVLPHGVFHNMRSLELLVLDRNLLEHLPWNIFANTSNLIELSIADNNLGRIDDNTFKNVKNLKQLSLPNNNLSNIDLSLIPSLISANVSSNLLTTLAISVAVVGLDASHNRINTVTGPSNGELESLFLQHNNLTNIAWLKRYSGLIVLDLSYNEIEKVTDNHFKNSYRLEKLYLSNNRLVALNLNSAPIRTLKTLDVRHNHLLVVETNKDQFNTLKELYLDHNAIVKLKLSSINMLQNLTISHNDWDCKNLDELFRNVSKSVIHDSDRSCKVNYKLKQGICCKESDKPYLERLIQLKSPSSDAEMLDSDESNPESELNGLKSDIGRLTKIEELLQDLQTNIAWIKSKMNDDDSPSSTDRPDRP